MDNVFKKFGLYDFFGIWGVGICFSSYCLASYYALDRDGAIGLFDELFETNVIVSGVICIALTYFIGILFHEIGKFIADSMGGIFGLSHYSEIEIKKCFNKCCLRFLFPNKYAANQCRKRIDDFINDIGETNAENASVTYVMAYLRHNNINSRMDKNHSTYGLARGLWVGSIVHFILLIAYILYSLITGNAGVKLSYFVLSVLSVIICYVLYCRTYKAYLAFIRSIYTAFWMHRLDSDTVE